MIHFSLTKRIRRDYQPNKTLVNRWLRKSLINSYKNVYIDISIVNSETSKTLNYQYRHKNYPTNIISLEYVNSRDSFAMLTGELILCDEIILHEAREQKKSILDHYAHMLVHGMLHLQGLDHIVEADALYMEQLEIDILSQFAIKNPYVIVEDI
jgi:probable rRNA maturation factor